MLTLAPLSSKDSNCLCRGGAGPTPGDKVIAGESHRMAGPSTHFSFRDCKNTLSTIRERLEHATCIGSRRQPEMDFKCLACDCAPDGANPIGQPEVDSASVGRNAWREIKNVHATPCKFIGELLACCRSLPNSTEHAPRAIVGEHRQSIQENACEMAPRVIDAVLTFAGYELAADG